MNGSRVINMILERESLKAGTFAKNIGITPTQVYDLQKGKIQNISSKIAQKILKVYPHYSYSWLLTGEGEMLKTEEEKAASDFDNTVKEMVKTKINLMSQPIPMPQKVTIKPVGGANRSTGMAERLNLLGYESPKEESGYKAILADILERVASNPLQVAELITGVKQQPAISEEMVGLITKPLLDRLSHETRRSAELEAKLAAMEMGIAK